MNQRLPTLCRQTVWHLLALDRMPRYEIAGVPQQDGMKSYLGTLGGTTTYAFESGTISPSVTSPGAYYTWISDQLQLALPSGAAGSPPIIRGIDMDQVAEPDV